MDGNYKVGIGFLVLNSAETAILGRAGR